MDKLLFVIALCLGGERLKTLLGVFKDFINNNAPSFLTERYYQPLHDCKCWVGRMGL